MISPKIHCLSKKNDDSPPVILISWVVTWFTWKMFPPPKEANTQKIAKKNASTMPSDFRPRCSKPSRR